MVSATRSRTRSRERTGRRILKKDKNMVSASRSRERTGEY